MTLIDILPICEHIRSNQCSLLGTKIFRVGSQCKHVARCSYYYKDHETTFNNWFFDIKLLNLKTLATRF